MGCCASAANQEGAAVTGKFAADAVIYARDDHASTFQQMRLARDLHKATGGTLWLEFIYEESLEEVRKAFATQSKEDDAEALAAVLKSLEHNGWSVEFNTSMVNLLTVAWKHSINVHALDDPEWSKDAFVARYGSNLGGLRYLANRASQLDDHEGATSRWCDKILSTRPKQSGPIVVLGGAEHGPPLIEFMKARVNVDVVYMYAEFEEADGE
ncbi:unnamed protein product, partial [Symbiodinium pilosum]